MGKLFRFREIPKGQRWLCLQLLMKFHEEDLPVEMGMCVLHFVFEKDATGCHYRYECRVRTCHRQALLGYYWCDKHACRAWGCLRRVEESPRGYQWQRCNVHLTNKVQWKQCVYIRPCNHHSPVTIKHRESCKHRKPCSYPVVEGSRFCEEHQCILCQQGRVWKRGELQKYCEGHIKTKTCQLNLLSSCYRDRWISPEGLSPYCEWHTCAAPHCFQRAYWKDYCQEHTIRCDWCGRKIHPHYTHVVMDRQREIIYYNSKTDPAPKRTQYFSSSRP